MHKEIKHLKSKIIKSMDHIINRNQYKKNRCYKRKIYYLRNKLFRRNSRCNYKVWRILLKTKVACIKSVKLRNVVEKEAFVALKAKQAVTRRDGAANKLAFTKSTDNAHETGKRIKQ